MVQRDTYPTLVAGEGTLHYYTSAIIHHSKFVSDSFVIVHCIYCFLHYLWIKAFALIHRNQCSKSREFVCSPFRHLRGFLQEWNRLYGALNSTLLLAVKYNGILQIFSLVLPTSVPDGNPQRGPASSDRPYFKTKCKVHYALIRFQCGPSIPGWTARSTDNSTWTSARISVWIPVSK